MWEVNEFVGIEDLFVVFDCKLLVIYMWKMKWYINVVCVLLFVKLWWLKKKSIYFLILISMVCVDLIFMMLLIYYVY